MSLKQNDGAADISQTDGKKVKIGKCLYIYVVYLTFLSLTDCITLPLYYLDLNQFVVGGILAAAICTIVLLFKSRQYICFEKNQYGCKKVEILLCLFLLATALCRSISPDLSFDVKQGHVFWQTPGFVDNINENVFPAGFTFFFALGDRFFYYPRMILGYRLGTLANAWIMILSYLQTVYLLQNLVGEKIKKLRSQWGIEVENGDVLRGLRAFFVSEYFFALVAVMTYYAIADLGTYMVDMVAIPLLLWMTNRVLSDRRNDASTFELAFFALLCGLCFALKMTNAIFIAPLLLIFLWQNRKRIKAVEFLACFLIGIVPAAPYLIYSYISTGNPIYYFFNSFFQSPYYSDHPTKDARWGPETFLQVLIWPIHIVINPDERVSEISRWPQVYLLLGYVSGIVLLVKSILKKNCKNCIVIATFFSFTLLWLMASGYPRYALICELLATVVLFVFIVDLYGQTKKLQRILATVFLVVIAAQFALNAAGGILNKYDWYFRPEITLTNLKDSYKKNAAWLLRDRGLIGTDEQREKIDVFLSCNIQHGIMTLLDPDAPIINTYYIRTRLDRLVEEKNLNYREYYLEKVREQEANGMGIYDICIANEYEGMCEEANAIGAEIIGIEEVSGYFINRDTPLLLQYTLSGKENTRTLLSDQPTFSIPEGTEKIKISGIACMPAYVRWEVPNTILQVCAATEAGEIVLMEKEIEQWSYVNLDEVIDVSDIQGDMTIILKDANGASINGEIINLSVEAME